MSEKPMDDSDDREGLVYGGVCPVCGDEFTDGFNRLEDFEGESIDGVRMCIIDPPEECLFHLPEDQSDRCESCGVSTGLTEGERMGGWMCQNCGHLNSNNSQPSESDSDE